MSARGGALEVPAYEIVKMEPPDKLRSKGKAPEWGLPLEKLETGEAIICRCDMRVLASVAQERSWVLKREFKVRTLRDGRVGVFRIQ